MISLIKKPKKIEQIERIIKEIETNLPGNAITIIPQESKNEKSDNELNFKNHFFIQFMKKNKLSLIAITFTYIISALIILSNGIIFLVQFVPSIICLMLILTRQDQHNLEVSEHWFWVVKPEPTIANFVIYGWLSLNALMMLTLLWLGYLKASTAQRNQSLLLAIGFTLPLVGGIIAEAVFPLLFNLDYIPILTPLITTFTIAAFLSLKNNFLDYSPRHQWDQIVENMNEGILIVNSEGYIMYANKMFCEMLR